MNIGEQLIINHVYTNVYFKTKSPGCYCILA
jgi:hypothetical protein